MGILMVVTVAELPSRFDELAALVTAGTPVVVVSNGRRLALAPASAGAEATAGNAPIVAVREWKLGLSPGAMAMSEDFDANLTEEQFLRGDV